jgi:flavorubredoxin
VLNLRLWPQKLWKKILLLLILIAVLALVAFGVFAGLLISGAINREVASGIDVINEEGGKTALVVYQPGFSSFPKDVTYAFAQGLASSGWRVEVTTASSQTPTDTSKYSLLTLAYPMYGIWPGTAIVNYLNRTDSLNGTNTVVIVCGGGETGEINNTLTQQMQAVNGTFLEGFKFSYQDGSAVDKATQAGSNITP